MFYWIWNFIEFICRIDTWSYEMCLIYCLEGSFCCCLEINSSTHGGCGNNFNTLRPRQDGLHFPDDIFKWIFLNENVWILINISLKFVPRGPINNIPALVQVMAWRRPGDKPLSEPMMARLPTHICVTQPQWVNSSTHGGCGNNFKSVIFKLILMIKSMNTSCKIIFLVNATELMAWCH